MFLSFIEGLGSTDMMKGSLCLSLSGSLFSTFAALGTSCLKLWNSFTWYPGVVLVHAGMF